MKVLDHGLVFDASVAPAHERCCAFTSLLHLANGALICGFKSGPDKLSPADRLILMRSDDGGKAWRRLYDGFDTTFNGTPGSFSAGYPMELEPNRLLLTLHWVDRTDPARPLSNPETSGVLPMKYLLAGSGDGGRSWSPLREVSLWPHPGANPTGEIIRLSNGQLMLAYESWKDWDDVEGDQSANVKLSNDEGMTWSDPITMANDRTGRLYFWDNHLARQPETGRLLAAFWSHNAERGVDAPIHLAWGDPDGRQWEAPQPIPIEGQVTAPLFLDRDRLLLFYVHRHDPPSIRAVISQDAGKTWQDEQVVIHDGRGGTQSGMDRSRSDAEYWEDMTRWTFGHPKAVRLSGGRVLVVYYAPPTASVGAPCDADLAAESPTLSIHWACLE